MKIFQFLLSTTIIGLVLVSGCGGGNDDDKYAEDIEEPAPAPIEPKPPQVSILFKIFIADMNESELILGLVQTSIDDRGTYSFEIPATTDFGTLEKTDYKIPVRGGNSVDVIATGWIDDGADGHFGYFLPTGDPKEMIPFHGTTSLPNGSLVALFSLDGASFNPNQLYLLTGASSITPPDDGILSFFFYLPHDLDLSDNLGSYFVSTSSQSLYSNSFKRKVYYLPIPQGVQIFATDKIELRNPTEIYSEAEKKAAKSIRIEDRKIVVSGLSSNKPFYVHAILGEYRSNIIKVTLANLSPKLSTLELSPELIAFKIYNETQTVNFSNKGDEPLKISLVPSNPAIGLYEVGAANQTTAFSIAKNEDKTIMLKLPLVPATNKLLNNGLCPIVPTTISFRNVRDISTLGFGKKQETLTVYMNGNYDGKVLGKDEQNPFILLPVEYSIPGPITYHSYSLIEESNENLAYPTANAAGIIEAGETITLAVNLINEGEVATQSYSAYFSSVTEYVTKSDGSAAQNLKLNYSRIESGTTAEPLGTNAEETVLSLKINDELADGAELEFFYQGVDSTGFIFPCERFKLIISRVGPIDLKEIIIDDDDQGLSNQNTISFQDRKITKNDAGKIIELLPNFSNPSTHDIGPMTISLTAKDNLSYSAKNSSLISVIEGGSTRQHPGLAGKAQDNSLLAPFTVLVSPEYRDEKVFFHFTVKAQVSFPLLKNNPIKEYVFRSVFDRVGDIYTYEVGKTSDGKPITVFTNSRTGTHFYENGKEIEKN